MDYETIMAFVVLLAWAFGWWYLWYRLFKRIGRHWTWAFVMFVPVVGIVAIIWFIFYGWPSRSRPGDHGEYRQTGKML